jgi:arylsulfatase A-like enzyme
MQGIMKTLYLSLLLVVSCGLVTAADKLPNVVIIFADDLGYADVGYHGSPDMVTPHIDSIARNGVQFSAGYVTAPVCGPSRAGLRTGIYQNRFGAEDNPGPYKRSKDVTIGIPTEMNTMSERMKALGYRTCMIGKSHTGNGHEFHPLSSGYDEFFGFINGASNYRIDKQFGKKLNQEWNPIMRGRERVEVDDYLTNVFGDEAAAFINRSKDKPFFLYVPFNAIHGPIQATDEDLERFKSIKDKKRRIAVAMNYNLDLNVGKILSALKDNSLGKNTLIFFLSDNGGKPDGNHSFNTPLRGKKAQLWDGGIRIPFCMQWPAQVKGGRKVDIPAISMDLLPTVVAAAGGSVEKKIDGLNLLPLLCGKKKTLPERYLYWRFNKAWAIRDAEWKLIKPLESNTPKLFNIAKDISESEDLYKKKPEIAQRMQKAYDKWSSGLMPKLWGWDSSFPVHDPSMGAE